MGSSHYINKRLAPSSKPSGPVDGRRTAPSARALEVTHRAGLLNINGGTLHQPRQPSLTAVGALGITKNWLRVCAHHQREHLHQPVDGAVTTVSSAP